MDSKMLWQQFINTGDISSYLSYKSAKNFEEAEVKKLADKDTSPCHSGNEYWGSGQTYNTFN